MAKLAVRYKSMRIEKINPDWQWTRYRKVTVTRDSLITSYEQKYRPVFDADTLHRRLAKAYDDRRIRRVKIYDVLENWLSLFGVLSGDIEDLDENDFMKEAGQVWWIVQVFNVLRNYEYDGTVGLDPTRIKNSNALEIRIDVPNPSRVAGLGDGFFPYDWATRSPLDPGIAMSDNAITESAHTSERNISAKQATWQVTYLDLLEVIAKTIHAKVQGSVEITFEALNTIVLEEQGVNPSDFTFLNVSRDKFGSRKIPEKNANPANDTYRIEPVLQPKDLLGYIWMLVAEEFTEIPSVNFENCKGFDNCGNVLKRTRSRACRYCRLVVYAVTSYQSGDIAKNDDLINQAVPIHLRREEWGDSAKRVVEGITTLVSTGSGNGEDDYCARSPNNLHAMRKYQREWCSSTCQVRNRKKT